MLGYASHFGKLSMSQEHERIWTTNTREIRLTGSAESRLAELVQRGDRKASGNQPGLESDLDRVLAALLMARRLPACGAGGREGAPGTATATVLVSAELWQQRPPMISVR